MFKMIWEWITGWIYAQKEVGRAIEELQVDEHATECGDCPSLEELKKADLIEYANAHDVKVNKSDSKKVILEKIFSSK